MKKAIYLLLTFLFIGCSPNISSKENISSSSLISVVSSSSSTLNYDDLGFVFSNSMNYALRNSNGSEVEYYFEISNEDLYMYVYDSYGYVVLEEDEDFLHSFSLKSLSNEKYEVVMDVHGRNTSSENLNDLKKENFLSYFYNYIDDFKKEGTDKWLLNSNDLCKDLSNFFQLKSLRYCNNIEIIVNENGKIDKVNIYENDDPIVNASLEYKESEKFLMYKRWIDGGRKINERIIDYKTLYEYNGKVVSTYNKNKVKFTATVVAIDSDNNIYVANDDKVEGSVGIKVNKVSGDNVTLKDIVEISGVVDTKDYVVSIKDATITDLKEDAPYIPVYDEEMVVDSYGGGTYAAQIFSNSPFYDGSVYTTYTYVNKLPDAITSGDMIIDVICPSYQNGNNIYQMQVVIPSSLNLEKKDELFNEFKKSGIYNQEDSYELCLDNFVILYDVKYQYRIKLMATQSSYVYKKLNAQEKIERFNNLINFPMIEDAKEVSYRFGGTTGAYLEDSYGIEEKSTQGVFINFTDVTTNEKVFDYIQKIENYGALKYDEIKDVNNARHLIYQKQEVVIDILYTLIDTYTSSASVYVWVYNSKVLQCPSVKEKLEKLISPYFNVDNFLILEGTYDADYSVFELYGYADNLYSKDNPLICVTLDTKEKITDEYNKALIQMGYKQYRGANNKPFTYKSRGQSHTIFEKDGVFVDVATYHTSDYTYYKHEEYEYRLEILIYRNTAPMEVNKYNSLEKLISLYGKINEELIYEPVLPNDSKVEVWLKLGDYTMWSVNYGYGHSDQAFIYTSEVDVAFASIKESLINAGYKNSSNSLNSASFNKTVNGNVYYVFILKESEKGYVRLFHDVGGVDFIR